MDASTYIVFRFPYTLDHAGSRFSSPNLLGTRACLQEYKHYRQGGSKFWSARPGVDLYVAVDKSKIRTLVDEGLSFPVLRVGNSEFKTTVSGGGGTIWTDYLGTHVTACSNLRLAILKEVATHAIDPQAAKLLGIALPAHVAVDVRIDDALARLASTKRLVSGNPIMLKDGFSVYGQRKLEFDHWASPQMLSCKITGSSVRASLCRIDWIETAKLNSFSVKTTSNLNQDFI